MAALLPGRAAGQEPVTTSAPPGPVTLRAAAATVNITVSTSLADADEPGAAAAGYLKLGDVRGEATDARFRDWIALESIEFDRASVGHRRILPITITKRVDRSSPALRAAHSRRTPFAEGTLAVRDEREAAGYLVIKMKDVIVSSYQTGADIDGLTLQALVEVSSR